MPQIVKYIKLILLTSGALTFTMIYAAISPQAALQATFGESIDGPIVQIVVRNWGALIALVGATLMYSAFNPASRRLAITIAIVSKLAFIALILSFGSQYLQHQAGVAVAIDTITIALFVAFLASTWKTEPSAVEA